MKKFFLIAMIFNIFETAEAAPLTAQSYWEGLKKSFGYLYAGSYMQFQEKNNLYVAAVAAPALVISFNNDKRVSEKARQKPISKLAQISSDLAPVMGFPIISTITYSIGHSRDNVKMVQFATEYFGAMYLAFLETAGLSLISVHARPSNENVKVIESALRGKSSFPSGHVVPYAALTMKTLQFYGPYAAIAPAVLTVMTSVQRVREGKHYLSDVLGGVFLSVFASEGVRKAGAYSDNHHIYKLIFENNFSIGVIEHQNVIGPKVAIEF